MLTSASGIRHHAGTPVEAVQPEISEYSLSKGIDPAELVEVIVVNDSSTDETADII